MCVFITYTKYKVGTCMEKLFIAEIYEYVRNKNIQLIQFIQKHLVETNFICVAVIQTSTNIWTICNNLNEPNNECMHNINIIILKLFIKVPKKLTHYTKPISWKSNVASSEKYPSQCWQKILWTSLCNVLTQWYVQQSSPDGPYTFSSSIDFLSILTSDR
jgi:hypothetical protein